MFFVQVEPAVPQDVQTTATPPPPIETDVATDPVPTPMDEGPTSVAQIPVMPQSRHIIPQFVS